MDLNSQKLAKEWFDSANSDFLYAEIGLKEDRVFPQVGFLSQQIAEKCLKGLLVFNGIKSPKIHELPKLLSECMKINPNLDTLQDACELLSGFYIETRYPPDMPDYSKKDISNAFKQAKIIKETIESIINQ